MVLSQNHPQLQAVGSMLKGKVSIKQIRRGVVLVWPLEGTEYCFLILSDPVRVKDSRFIVKAKGPLGTTVLMLVTKTLKPGKN